MNEKKLKPQTLNEQTDATEISPDQFVYQQMFEAILAQRLLPGTKLTEEDLASIFDVSRTIVRRALLRLSHDSIVDIRPNRGAYVAQPSIKQAREIIQARRLIETALVKEVAQHASKADLEKLRTLVGQEQNRFEQDNRGSGIRLSGDFHFQLAAISGNTTLTGIVTKLIPQTSLIIAQYEKPGHINCSHTEHFELIDAITVGDSELAAQLMDQHLQGIENKLLLADRDAPVDLKQAFSHLKSP